MELERFDTVDATFKPKRTDDLKPRVNEWIGRRCIWEALWMIDEDDGGSYVGQWAMMPIIKPHKRHPDFPYLWVPLCDLEIHSA